MRNNRAQSRNGGNPPDFLGKQGKPVLSISKTYLGRENRPPVPGRIEKAPAKAATDARADTKIASNLTGLDLPDTAMGRAAQ